VILNPFYILVCIYFLANLVVMIQGINEGGMMLEFQYFNISPTSYIIAFLLQCSIVIIIVFLYPLFINKKKTNVYHLNGFWGWVGLILQTLSFCYEFFSGKYIAGQSLGASDGFLAMIILFFQPATLQVFISLYLKSNRLFAANMLFYLLFMFIKGWMGGIYVFSIILLCRYYPLKLSLKNFFALCSFILLVILLLPFLLEAKFIIRSGLDIRDAFNNVFSYGYIEHLGMTIGYVANRLQHVGHVAILYDHAEALNKSYLQGLFIPYYLEGILQQFIGKLFGIRYETLNIYMVSFLFNEKYPTWSSNPGLAGWIAILKENAFFLYVYVLFMLTVIGVFLRSIADSRLVLLFFCYAILYFYHGWVGAFFNFSLYLVIYSFLFKVRPSILKKINMHD